MESSRSSYSNIPRVNKTKPSIWNRRSIAQTEEKIPKTLPALINKFLLITLLLQKYKRIEQIRKVSKASKWSVIDPIVIRNWLVGQITIRDNAARYRSTEGWRERVVYRATVSNVNVVSEGDWKRRVDKRALNRASRPELTIFESDRLDPRRFTTGNRNDGFRGVHRGLAEFAP